MDRLTVRARLTLDDVDGALSIVTSKLDIDGHIPGLSQAGFEAAVVETAEFCPVSRLFAGAQITVNAQLSQA